MYLYAYELSYDKREVLFCELYFKCYIFPRALRKREEMNKGSVRAAMAVFQTRLQ